MTAIDQAGAILPFPLQNALTRPMRAAAGKAGKTDYLSLWAGQGGQLARREPAAQTMARLVRDLAKKTGRKVNFVMAGEDTELDKNVVDKIGDPLVHMVRNAIDHGLEATGEDRVAAGLVMTGGASRMEGAEELAEEIFHMPVRLATPTYVSGLSDVVNNAIHATGVGLLLYGNKADPAKNLVSSGGDSAFDRIRSWFRGEF